MGGSPSTPPIAATSFERLRLRERSSATTLPSRMTRMRSQVSRTSPRICEMSTQLRPWPTERRTWTSSWLAVCVSSEEVGSSRMTRRAGRSSDTVKAREISTICRRPIDRSCTRSSGETPWPGKISSSLSRMSPPARAPPAETANRRMDDPRVLGDGQVRAQRELLEDAAQPERLGARGGIVRAALRRRSTRRPRSGATAAVEDMH